MLRVVLGDGRRDGGQGHGEEAQARQVARGRRGTGSLGAGKSLSLSVKLNAKAKKGLKSLKSIKVKLTIVAIDAAGNRKETTKSVTVRR